STGRPPARATRAAEPRLPKARLVGRRPRRITSSRGLRGAHRRPGPSPGSVPAPAQAPAPKARAFAAHTGAQPQAQAPARPQPRPQPQKPRPSRRLIHRRAKQRVAPPPGGFQRGAVARRCAAHRRATAARGPPLARDARGRAGPVPPGVWGRGPPPASAAKPRPTARKAHRRAKPPASAPQSPAPQSPAPQSPAPRKAAAAPAQEGASQKRRRPDGVTGRASGR
ncbi:MAG: hypothetical protein RL071_827, partial [Pseudomonadota bacterium]